MKSLANAVGAKTARACDSCVKRRARWYCAADDAFLCQSCDSLVHSANPLARRHERVRLKTASPAAVKHSNHSSSASPPHEAATWHHGFTRKARTPRGSGKKNNLSIFHDLVPEISVEDQTDSYELEEQLICQVPVLDPLVAEQFLNDVVAPKIEFPMISVMIDEDEDNAESCLNGFFPTDMELEEFAADVETLLGRGLDTESYAMEDLGFSNTEMFKVEKDEIEEEEVEEKKAINMEIFDDDDRKDVDGTVPFELSFDYESSHKTSEEEVMKNVESSGECVVKVKEEEEKNVLMLRLNYDSVISTWGGQGPPWTSGEPPKLDIDISSWPPVSMGEFGGDQSHQKQYVGGCLPSSGFGDGGREARVSRYREKRRTRLFSKKIRYEVRKLNAEKRPRMKGRFVKRAALTAAAANSPLGVNY
ncbi:PREDICTED: zinc finger protein CONSTANS-LIKE 16-like isoform X1 [Camelina sativa]|uniref:Zinc finger protein CONSTANS-LIKE 16-like isoform X1 n=1 Tax=Camelina sativa TaxID=90675 RepID=A0ABM0VS92_CAMSA|nr:PREDICTED: zinc finger protein CONSTANS-LIKE 16-like isoform X1 [Camelina sativa]